MPAVFILKTCVGFTPTFCYSFMFPLSGSERQSKSGAVAATLAEGCQINKSLSCLANVIQACCLLLQIESVNLKTYRSPYFMVGAHFRFQRAFTRPVPRQQAHESPARQPCTLEVSARENIPCDR